MAAGKKAAGPSKQKTITSFFGGGKSKSTKSKPVPTDDSDASSENAEDAIEDEAVDDASDLEMDVDDEPSKKGKKKSNYVPPEESSLPPISNLPDIFSDIVSRIPGIEQVAQRVKGRKLRVATMCSGTESPLLALGLIRRAILAQHGVDLEIEHVFSCEIVPFKQAYIERNFQPPLLFRDVCELGGEYAYTAYGSEAIVPGNVDILIAGTSCVDYSHLNNQKKGIDGGGESGRTFYGMLNWVIKHQPPIVLLENVCSAPWAGVKDRFRGIGYSAESMFLDTKYYYIPHTRTRGYMMAINLKKSSLPEKWVKMMVDLRREASSSLDAWLLAADDPRIFQSKEKLVQESYNAADRKTGRTDWARCESRHQRARLDEELGGKRPSTNWDEGGSCKAYDYTWADWMAGQVERVWDLLDISLLRSAIEGVDPAFKTQVWNLSQNVDRSTGSNKLGISPCLTPSMIPYITNRGGPMVGLEALHLQGLPINELLLTRESEDQLADLAGNAMSTTVVGTAMLAALVLGHKLLKEGSDKSTYEGTSGLEEVVEADFETMDIDTPSESIEDHITGEDQLVEQPLDLSTTVEEQLSSIVAESLRSVRLCECEGRKDVTERELHRCKDCGWTSCIKCGGRPEHNYEVIDVKSSPRITPSVFDRQFKSSLPMCIMFSDVTGQLLDTLKEQAGVSIPSKRWSAWRSAVLQATKLELRFMETKRQEIWSATYESDRARLELSLHPGRPEWLFFAKPEPSEPANAEIRRILLLPAARLVCEGALLRGQWEFGLPYTREVEIALEGVGEPVPSWQAKLGLQLPKFKDSTVHSQIQVSVDEGDVLHFDRDITGMYTLLDQCGTANSALHKKIATDKDASQPPIFLLMNPTRCGNPKDDAFVFSTSIRRFEYGETRPIVARVDPSWRQSDEEGEQKIICSIPQKYMIAVNVQLKPSPLGKEATFAVPEGALNISLDNDSCKTANALLVARIPLRSQAGLEWPRQAWKEVEHIHERATFRSLSWLIERIKAINGPFLSWQSVPLHQHDGNCQRCAPASPSLRWTKEGKSIVAVEDSIEAGEYERRLKRRPAPFVTQMKVDDDGIGHVRIGVDVASLIHRALSRLPSAGRSGERTVTWRLDTDFKPLVKLILPKFKLSSNRQDPEHSQPPSFVRPLRKEQLRSLDWMLRQEAIDAPPFIEEEISEAILDPLGWRAEGRAQQPVRVRGGVLADEVGYGKTAITLALIDSTRKAVKKSVAKAQEMPGKIRVAATLVVVPGHLTKQWASEVTKFVGKNHFKVVLLQNVSHLNSLKIEDVEEADLVIVASSLFKGVNYLDNLEAFAAGGSLPKTEGRYFNARLTTCLASLREQVDRLRDEGSLAVLDAIHAARKKDKETQEAMRPSKRLRGVQPTVAGKSAPTKAKSSSVTKGAKVAKAIVKKADDTSEDSGKESKPKKFSHVEVPRHEVNKGSSSATTPPTTADENSSDEESDPPKPRKRQAAAKFRYSDALDDESEDEQLPKGKRRITKYKSGRSSSPDAFVPSDQESEDDDEDAEPSGPSDDEEEDSDAPKSKSKSKAKPKPKPKPQTKGKRKASSEDADDAMDVDEDEGASSSVASSTTSKKRKREEKETKPKVLREAKDPWKLRGAAKRDWKEMQAPPLEMFHFERKVVDEYTYLEGVVHSLTTKVTAERSWVLSGTPPIHDFSAVKTIAAFLDLHLGVDDDGEGQSAQVKKRRRDQTAAEKFHSFRETHSLDWHAHRHQVGQTFLDRYVRQNVAEIDEIPWEEKIEKINLPAAERAIYLELEHHLRALDMTIKRSKKTESDREKRLAQSLGDSKTAEEALLKRCSHFELETSDKDNAMQACSVIVKERQRQLDECKTELMKNLVSALEQEKKIEKELKKDTGRGSTGEESLFQEYVRVNFIEGAGDAEATKMIKELMLEAGIQQPAVNSKNTKVSEMKGKPKGKDDSISAKTKDLMWDHREHTHVLRRLNKELVGRVRSLRYFTAVRDLQKQREVPLVVSCPSCGREEVPIEDIAVLSSCGHAGCLACVNACATEEKCVYSDSGECKALARMLNVVKGESLGVDDEQRDGKGKHFGLKLEKIIHLIKKRIQSTERMLIFVQFPDLMKKVAEALEANKIQFLEIKGSASAKSKSLEKFQQEGKERVLLLNVMDESASGANLTCANHAIFLSPLLATSQEIYDACETQAIGRLRRYGQTSLVHIWRFLTTDTIDVEIFEQRTKRKV
ncbi:hypothetical protein EW146_g5422 [Bondarzewia mesenterica]|uniref:Helicase ATP-binding domain-containing protein n=1 Tax=Bondarzewia mesenterica TaxID=1095465 RepID=A0A4S4LRK0_9AGAM|nr:hypothetical protein EW146_g5422 [Bondarzewia mesenterica]